MTTHTLADRENTLLIATQNAGKLAEIRNFLQSGPAAAWRGPIVGAGDLQLGAAEETGTTYVENALLKARFLRDATGYWTLADDAGLSVDALGGAPGVDTAHYGGFTRLLHEMFHVNPCDRTATFHCVLALAAPDGREWTFEGQCQGCITQAPRGAGGFGYDPVFLPRGSALTFAEMETSAKAAVSHRGLALQKFLSWLVGNSAPRPEAN